MTVYIEDVFLENFLLDGLLLYLSLVCARVKVRFPRLIAAAVLGGGEALLFPLFRVPVWAGYIIKVSGGLILPLTAARGSVRAHILTSVIFFALTFLLGGVLTAVGCFSDAVAVSGAFFVERVPVALVFSVAGIFAVCVVHGARALYAHTKTERLVYRCRLTAGCRTVTWRGFADSGNCLFFCGKPVGVISAAGVFALLGAHPKAIGRMKVGTIDAQTERPVFLADRLEIGQRSFCKICLTVGDTGPRYQLILHSAWTEGGI